METPWQVWSFNAPGAGCLGCPPDGFTALSLCDDGAAILTGSMNSQLYKLNATNGDLLWAGSTSADHYSDYGSLEGATPSLSVSGDTVFVGSDDASVYALNAVLHRRERLALRHREPAGGAHSALAGDIHPGADRRQPVPGQHQREVFKLNIGLGSV